MNIYEKAQELAAALKESEEFQSFTAANAKIASNENAKLMIEDFRKLQFEAYSEQMQNNAVSKETEEKFKNLVTVMSMNGDVAAYMESEQRFGAIWQQVMEILSKAVEAQ